MRAPWLLVLLVAPAWGQAVYRWKDARGEVHYTDDASTIPRGARVETTEGDEVMVVPATKPPPPSPVPAQPARVEPARKRARRPGPVEVKLTALQVPVSDADRQFIEAAVKAAAASPRLGEYGGLREGVDVEVASAQRMSGCDGSGAFGLALGNNLVYLRAPKDTRARAGRPLDYQGTALHELGHILEHQHAGTQRPRWFAEGFACHLAEVGRAAAVDDVAWWVIHEGGARPLDAMFDGSRRCSVHLAYAIAKEAVDFLVKLVGAAGVRRMFELRDQGQAFDAAFAAAAGFDVGEFQRRFIESLRPHYYERAR